MVRKLTAQTKADRECDGDAARTDMPVRRRGEPEETVLPSRVP